MNKTQVAALGGSIGLVLASAVALASTADNGALGVEAAKETCRAAIRSALRTPSTAKFVSADGKVFKGIPRPTGESLNSEVVVAVDAENFFGAKVRSSYRCEMYESEKKWKISHVYRLGG